MAPRPKSAPHPSAPALVPVLVPAWLRRAARAPGPPEEIALAAGAALGVLDLVVRRQEAWAGVWRQRLALRAAGICAHRAGRTEDEAGLRDAVMLTRPGDDPGPAGAILRAWQRLAARPIATLPGGDDAVFAVFGDAAGARMRAPAPQAGGIVAALAAALGPTGDVGAGGAGIAAEHAPWLADLRLAQGLGWRVVVPLLGTQPPGRPGTEVALLRALTRAALQAVDLAADLGRRADRLTAVAPKLRARAAGAVLGRLLDVDAMTAADPVAGISDRGLRRLFERLVDLEALRELSGRSSFRLYGL